MQPGRCAYFDGTNYIAAPKLSSGELISSFKIKVRVKLGVITGERAILGNLEGGTVNTGWEINFSAANSNKLRFVICVIESSGANTSLIIGYDIPDPKTQWLDIEINYQAPIITCTMNGVVSSQYSVGNRNFIDTTKENTLLIGRRWNATNSLIGYVSDAQIYYNDTLKAHYKLDEGAGTIAYDSSGNGRHGTWTGLVASSHYTGADVPYSYQNQVGYGNKIQANGNQVNKPIYPLSRTSVIPFLVSGTSTNQFIHIPRNVGLRVYIESPVAFDVKHGAYSGGVVTLGTTNVWHTFTSYPDGVGTYSVIDLRAAGAGADWDKIFITAEVLTLFPRNEANPTQDVLGNVLTYAGKAPVDATLKGSHCGYGNGTSYVELPNALSDFNAVHHTGFFDITFYASFENRTSTTKVNVLLGNAWVGAGFRITYTNSYTGSTIKVITLLMNGIEVIRSRVIDDALMHKIRVFGDGVKAYIHIDDVDATTQVNNLPLNTSNPTYAFRVVGGVSTGGTHGHIGMMCGVKLIAGGVTLINMPFSEGGGATLHNNAGTTHGTLTGDATVFWSKTQDVFHYNLTKGFTLNGAVKIPAKNATQDALGNALTNPAGKWYNMAETGVDFSGGIASPYSLKVPLNWKGAMEAGIAFRNTPTKADRILTNNTAVLAGKRQRMDYYAPNTMRFVPNLRGNHEITFGDCPNLEIHHYVLRVVTIPRRVNVNQTIFSIQSCTSSEGVYMNIDGNAQLSGWGNNILARPNAVAQGVTDRTIVKDTKYDLIFFTKNAIKGAYVNGIYSEEAATTTPYQYSRAFEPRTIIGARSNNNTPETNSIATRYSGDILLFQFAPYSDENVELALQGKDLKNMLLNIPLTEGVGLVVENITNQTRNGILNTGATWTTLNK
jgi:hypothetical protein